MTRLAAGVSAERERRRQPDQGDHAQEARRRMVAIGMPGRLTIGAGSLAEDHLKSVSSMKPLISTVLCKLVLITFQS